MTNYKLLEFLCESSLRGRYDRSNLYYHHSYHKEIASVVKNSFAMTRCCLITYARGLLLFLLLIITITSCETVEDTNDFPTEPSKLVVNCLFNPDSVWFFQISKSLSVLDNAELTYIGDATVKLYEDESLIETIYASTDPTYGYITYRSTTNKPLAGKTYSIEVSADGFEDATSEGVLPNPVSFQTNQFILVDTIIYSYEEYGDTTKYMDMEAKLNIQIEDPATEDNYYELYTMYLDTIYYGLDSTTEWYVESYYPYLDSDDPSVQGTDYTTGSIFFTDKLFNGQKHEISASLFGSWSVNIMSTMKLYVILRTHSKDSYYYKESYALYQQSGDDFFAEPVQVYNNIENGFGIFGGYVSQSDTVIVF